MLLLYWSSLRIPDYWVVLYSCIDFRQHAHWLFMTHYFQRKVIVNGCDIPLRIRVRKLSASGLDSGLRFDNWEKSAQFTEHPFQVELGR